MFFFFYIGIKLLPTMKTLVIVIVSLTERGFFLLTRLEQNSKMAIRASLNHDMI